MEITLPDALLEFAKRQVETGAFASIDEVVAASLENFESVQEADEQSVLRGLSDIDAGHFSPAEEVLGRIGKKLEA